MSNERPSTHEKALQINLAPAIHGTFAEIGAGQEVARWFFHVGGAAATVAKTISAYDMAVSDAIYGPSPRYVSRERLSAMLDHEYGLLGERLGAKRGATTSFFVFADTVAARSYSRKDRGQGWLGLRFQHEPQAPPSEITLHVDLLDTENVREQETLGILGVNLIYGAYFCRSDVNTLIQSLGDGLTTERFDVDMIRFSGPCFAQVDNRLASLKLVEFGFTSAAMFTAEGEVVQPTDALYKRPVLMARGDFRPVTNTVLDMLDCATAQFEAELASSGAQPLVILEMSLQNLLRGARVDPVDFLERADVLGALGKTVMITNFDHHYHLSPYLRRCTSNRIAFVMGIPALRQLFDPAFYADLEGGLLEALGEYFRRDVVLFVHPTYDPATGRVISSDTLELPRQVRHLHAYLSEQNCLRPIRHANERYLQIQPDQVRARIESGDPSWETLVPRQVAARIKEHRLFGYHQGDLLS